MGGNLLREKTLCYSLKYYEFLGYRTDHLFYMGVIQNTYNGFCCTKACFSPNAISHKQFKTQNLVQLLVPVLANYFVQNILIVYA